MCTFNDDMQGTGATAAPYVMAGFKSIGADGSGVLFFGAGTAGVGIADQLFQYLVDSGVPADAARQQFWLIDRQGLLCHDTQGLALFQKPYARNRAEVEHWQLDNSNDINLLDVVRNTQPTVLIGCSAVPGAFSQAVVQAMAAACERPIIFPLSNPTAGRGGAG